MSLTLTLTLTLTLNFIIINAVFNMNYWYYLKTDSVSKTKSNLPSEITFPEMISLFCKASTSDLNGVTDDFGEDTISKTTSVRREPLFFMDRATLN